MAKPICLMCFGKNKEKSYSAYFCLLCAKTVDHSICLVSKGKLSATTINGITFDASNWDQHWDVVKRRLEEGTETRLVKAIIREKPHKIEAVDTGEIPGIAIDGLWCPYSQLALGNWHFVDSPQQEKAETTTLDLPHNCKSCSNPMYIGLSGVFCDKRGAFNEG